MIVIDPEGFNPIKNYTGIILAGGKSTRLGGVSKARIVFDGKPLLMHAADAFRRMFRDVWIVAGASDGFVDMGLPVVRDSFFDVGPLGGIHAGLSVANTQHVFVTACDQPFINEPLVRAMAGAAGDSDAFIPRMEQLLFPLFACYSKRCLPVIEEHIGRGMLQVRKIYPHVRTRYADRIWMEQFDPEMKSVININTPQDFEAACRAADVPRESVA